MKRHLCITAAALALGACATPERYDTALQPWTGAQEAELLRGWGLPTRSHEAGGHRFIVYESSRNVHVPGTAAAGTGAGNPAMDVHLSCTTTFELEQGRVVSWSYQGNDCSPRKALPSHAM
jgi:hypothetical protein